MPKLDYDLTETQLNTLHMLGVEIIFSRSYYFAHKTDDWHNTLVQKRKIFGRSVYSVVKRAHCQTIYNCVTKNINKYEWRE